MNDDRREYLRKVAALSVKPKRRLIEALIEAERRIRELEETLSDWVDGSVDEAAVVRDDDMSCPDCGGPADNGHDREYPPSPYVCTKCEAAEDA